MIAAKLDIFTLIVKMNLVVLPASVMATRLNVSSVEASAKVGKPFSRENCKNFLKRLLILKNAHFSSSNNK